MPLDALHETWAEALGQLLADERKAWARDREFVIADLRREFAEGKIAILDRLAKAIAEMPPGPRGEPGDRGEPGEAITGPPGEQGIPGPPGEPGRDAPFGEVCGLHDPARVYRMFDIVVRDGAEWRARCNDPGALPGVGWALSAEQGKRGKPGDRGERGMVGPAGPPGPSGAIIVDWAVDGYRAAPIMSDGTTGPVLDMRGFFERYDGEAR